MTAGRPPRAAVSARQRQGSQAAGHGDRAGGGTPRPGIRVTGRVRLALLRDLAMGEWSHATLAGQLGVTARDVQAFADAHASEIAEVSAALAGKLAVETAGMWISKRQNRLAELQSLYEDGERVMAHLRELDITDGSGLGSRRHFNTNRAQLAILGAAADEVEPRRGQPTPQEGITARRYIVEGIDPERLM